MPAALVQLEDDLAGRVEELIDLCGRLVAAPSINPPGDTRAVADVVLAELRAAGLDPDVHAQDPAMPNIVVTVEGGSPGPHVVWNAHMDTMPAGDERLWTVPPGVTTRRDDRLYGLGMGNMKGALGAMMLGITALARHPAAFAGRVTFTAVSDEVVFGDNGAAFLLRTLPDLVGDALISGEGPGFGRIAVAEKGVCWLALTAGAEGGHSSSVRPGHSATARLARATLAVDALTGRATSLPAELTAGGAPFGGAGDPGRLLTANVGTAHAGSFVGQVATDGVAEVDLRLPPGIGMDALQAEIDALAGADVAVSRIKGWDANWTPPADPLVQAVTATVARLRGSAPELAIRLPASDASRWRARGVPALCFGPQPSLSAGIDDHATIDALRECMLAYALSTAAYTHAS